eukprot:2586818-Amphidinium_carterae.1
MLAEGSSVVVAFTSGGKTVRQLKHVYISSFQKRLELTCEFLNLTSSVVAPAAMPPSVCQRFFATEVST